MCVVVPSILGHGWDLGNKMPRGESEREREREHPKWIPMVATRQDSVEF